MSLSERIVFQPFVWRGTRLEAGTAVLCRNSQDAHRRIDKVRAGILSVAGALVVRMEVDEEAGDYGEPEYLERIGCVPEAED
ncbi:hypothetical protein CSR02_13990 [Acetobacter pomorum]|uniref:Uncharacterized protein n=1 Tax=Acetobacter pomorum TaxID=65959 RepID=A0A2G4R8Z9_9PROT|nr:hypothetical protein [Acetobacter pomorum]PHY93028.1 hypothetical protein CSR02_13990 [Acetobacter pomorum]GBR48817.1 hypothetical protein AA11825_1122 [Acetobacter pomorum DSM 11825]